MKSLLRVRTSASLLATLLLVAGCTAAPSDPNSHWNIGSVDNSITKHFLGYRGAIDGSYLQYQAEKKQHVGQTLKRHFLNHNGENPLQAYSPERAKVRPAHGPIPDPAYWFNAEAVLWGAVTAVASGTFIPIPVDSILAWGSEGGFGEFTGTFVGDFETDDSGPPAPRKFRVKNH